MEKNTPWVLRLAALWVLYGLWASNAGWLLSALGALHRVGYLVAAVPLLVAVAWFWRSTGPSGAIRPGFRRLLRLPGFLPWLTVTTLVFVGGCLFPPTNYDALIYRTARVCFWLQNQGWYWLDDSEFRLNIAGTGFEWMSAPWILFMGSERWTFLLNFLPFLLIPGLFFLGSRALGVQRRTALWWMWMAPMPYGFVLQAASVGNDMVGGVYFVASLAFAAQADRGRPVLWLGFSALAAVLMTGLKVTMLPLGLPLLWVWIVQIRKHLPVAPTIRLAGLVTLPAVLASFLPIAILCHRHTGHWTGNPDNVHGIEIEDPGAATAANGMDLGASFLTLPAFPGAERVNSRVHTALLGYDWYAGVCEEYPKWAFAPAVELPSEESAGIGIGMGSLLLLWPLLTSGRKLRGGRLVAMCFAGALGIATLAFLAKAGGAAATRLMLPWVPGLVIVAISLRGPVGKLPRPVWAWIPAATVIVPLCLNPNRPLASTMLPVATGILPESVVGRVEEVYRVYGGRYDLIAPLAEGIPNGAAVGFAGDGTPIVPLFRPIGRLDVRELSPGNVAEIDWIVGTPAEIRRRLGISETGALPDDFEVRARSEFTSMVRRGPEDWMLLRRIPSAPRD
ncbi:hypothetical protein HAHE_22110 [Haloferula helveola]|uniref:Glycosyltransferase RgtA/B/C/D-like domain-containing protein n=1 Tax=Haloferula helveola TaxID=490095 RepID=A0ABN6H3Z5_9BACT|nr:hypothetical protein HAHE_22110 [Haloferula helveola]